MSWKEQQGKCLRQFFKRKLLLGKKLILPSDFKTIPFENFILWEIAAGKLDSSRVWYRKSLLLANNKGTDRTAVMSKTAYLSVEIVTDKPTTGKNFYTTGSLCS